MSNHELLHLRTQSGPIVLGQVDGHTDHETTFSGKPKNQPIPLINHLFIHF